MIDVSSRKHRPRKQFQLFNSAICAFVLCFLFLLGLPEQAAAQAGFSPGVQNALGKTQGAAEEKDQRPIRFAPLPLVWHYFQIMDVWR